MIGIVLLGPPGVGKGTQALRLRDALNLFHLSTGDALRGAIKSGTPLGARVKGIIESGALVSDEIVGQVVEAALTDGLSGRAGFLLDGFPRTLGQVKILDDLLARRGLTLDHAVLIDAPQQVILRRLTGRRVCSRCDAVFHLETKPPRVEGVCDACGSPLVQRADDREEAVQERLRVYRDQTDPVAAAYAARGLLRRVDGSGAPEAVFAAIRTMLGGVAA